VCFKGSVENDGQWSAEYIGKDIWVVKGTYLFSVCTFTVHDKEARVIQPK
jgi:hypothetical protein